MRLKSQLRRAGSQISTWKERISTMKKSKRCFLKRSRHHMSFRSWVKVKTMPFNSQSCKISSMWGSSSRNLLAKTCWWKLTPFCLLLATKFFSKITRKHLLLNWRVWLVESRSSCTRIISHCWFSLNLSQRGTGVAIKGRWMQMRLLKASSVWLRTLVIEIDY